MRRRVIGASVLLAALLTLGACTSPSAASAGDGNPAGVVVLHVTVDGRRIPCIDIPTDNGWDGAHALSCDWTHS